MGNRSRARVFGGRTSSRRVGRFVKCIGALAVTAGALVVTGTAVSGAPTTPSNPAQSQSVPSFSAPPGLVFGAVTSAAPLLTAPPAVIASPATPVNTYTVTTTADPTSGTACPASGGDPCSLRAAVDQANTDGTFDKIVLPAGLYLLEQGQLLADDVAGITIAGGSGTPTIKADPTSGDYPFRVFEVEGTLSINNATVTDGSINGDGVGGGIDVADGSLALNGSTVSDSGAADGGGIYVAPGAQAFLSNSTVTDNEGINGVGIDDEGQVLASNLSVTDNFADGNGGGIAVSNEFPNAGFNGSGLTVSDNYASSEGAGIFNEEGTLALSNSTVSDNGRFETLVTAEGGGLTNGGIATLDSVTVSDNTAGEDGAGITNYGQLSMTGGKITENGQSGDYPEFGGGGLADYFEASLTDVTVTENTGFGGAGLFVITEEPPASLVVTGGSVSDNGGETEFGGGIGVVEGTLTVTGTTMTGDLGGSGGAIGAIEGSTVTLTNDTFGTRLDPNQAEDGGALDLYLGASAVISGSTISYSLAEEYGGGIDAELGTVVTVQNSTVADNSSTFGGGLDVDEALGTITGSTISFNSASDDGAGMDVYGADVSMTNDTVASNTVGTTINEGFGGGIDFDSESNAVLDNVTVARNSAYGSGPQGAGVLFVDGSSVQSKGTLFAYNDSSYGGFNDNCAYFGGAAISDGYNLSSDATCGFAGPGDLNSVNPNLGALANNGGPTKTDKVPSGSKAVKAEANCPPPSTDQRGVKRSKPCTIGAYQA